MSMVKVGVVGVGAVGRMAHLQSYLEHPDADIVAIADANPENLSQVQHDLEERQGHEVAAFASGEAMSSAVGLDAVSIATPNTAHFKPTIAALEAGSFVLLEKPMTVDVAEAEQIVAKAKRAERWVMVGMTHRFRDDARALQRFVAAGELGSIYYGEARILRRRGTPTGWYTDRKISGGGPLMDIGPHALDLGWWMMGCPEPLRVSGYTTKAIGHDGLDFLDRWKTYTPGNQDNAVYDTEDFATALIYFKTGATLHLTVAWSVNGPQDSGLKVNVYGSQGGLSLDPPTVFSARHQVFTDTHVPLTAGDYYKEEFGHFIRCIMAGQEPTVLADSGLTVVRMLRAIKESAQSGKDVILGE